MRKFLPVLLFFIPTIVFSQGIEWSVNVSPTISFRMPQKNNLTAQAVTIQAGEKPMHAFDFGFDMRTPINSRVKIGAAILYSQKGFSNIHLAAVFDDERISRAYLIDYVQDYIEIPFFLTYSVLQKEKVQLYPLLGVTNSILLHDKNNTAIRRGGEIREEIQKKISSPYLQSTQQHNVGLLLGWGAMACVDKKTFVGIEAQTKLMLTPLQDKASITHRYLYSFGMNFRFIRRLR